MNKWIVLALLVVGGAGCSKPEPAPPPPTENTAVQAAPVQSAPGAPSNAAQPLTDGRVDKSADGAGPSGPGVGGK